MTYIHDTVIREYLSGKPIQRKDSWGKWIDIAIYGTESSIPMFVDSLEYRVKPKVKYCFFHSTVMLLHGSNPERRDAVMFNYPEYEPSGPHIMIKYSGNEIIETYHSNTSSTGYLNGTIS